MRRPGARHLLTTCTAVAIAAGLAAAPTGAQTSEPPAAAEYTATDLGTLDGGQCTLYGIADGGSAVGYASVGTEQHGAGWTEAGGLVDLGVPAGFTQANLSDANAAGHAVGNAFTPNPPPWGTQIALWRRPDGSFVDVSTAIGPPTAGQISGINGALIATGEAGGIGGATSNPIRWDLGAGTWSLLAGFDGVSASTSGINEAGLIAGTRDDAPERAFRHDPSTGATTFAGTLGGSYSEGNAINEAGMVVGDSAVASGASHPFLWDPATGDMTDLGLPPGATGAVALDVNDALQVVGFYDDASGGGAFLWDPIHGMQVLSAPDTLAGPYPAAIDASGRIVGSATTTGTTESVHCVVWEPPAPPPPSTTTTTAGPTATTAAPLPVAVVVTPTFTG